MKINNNQIPGDYQYNALRRGNPIQKQWHRNRHNLIRYLNFFNKKDHVLDAGCGSGNVIFEFSKDVKDMVGIDNNKDCILFIKNRAKKSGIKNIEVQENDLLSFNLGNKKFNKIIMTEIIEHFSEDDIKKLLLSVKRIMAPGARLLITTPNSKSSWVLLEAIINLLNLTPRLWGEQHLTKFTSNRLSDILIESGFVVKKRGTLNTISPFIAPLSQKLADRISYLEFKYTNFGNLLYVVAKLK